MKHNLGDTTQVIINPIDNGYMIETRVCEVDTDSPKLLYNYGDGVEKYCATLQEALDLVKTLF